MPLLKYHIFLWGLPGAGKSMALSYIKSVVPYPIIDLDLLITEKVGSSIPEIFQNIGEPGFREIEQQCLSSILNSPASIVATGGGTPCFGSNAQLMMEVGTPIWLDVPQERILLHLDGDEGKRPHFTPLTVDERRKLIHKLYLERVDYYQQAPYKINVSDNLGWLPGLLGLIWSLTEDLPHK